MGEIPPVERINMYWKTGIHNPAANISAVHIRHKYSKAKEEPAEATNAEVSHGKKKSTIEKKIPKEKGQCLNMIRLFSDNSYVYVRTFLQSNKIIQSWRVCTCIKRLIRTNHLGMRRVV